jgi:hypothetical protein
MGSHKGGAHEQAHQSQDKISQSVENRKENLKD